MEEEGYVQREITTDDSGNNTQMETLSLYSKGTLYSRDAGSEVWNQTEKEDSLDIVSFGTFERVKTVPSPRSITSMTATEISRA